MKRGVPVLETFGDAKKLINSVCSQLFYVGDTPFYISGLEAIMPDFTMITTSSHGERCLPPFVKCIQSCSNGPNPSSRRPLAQVLLDPVVTNSLRRSHRKPSLLSFDFDESCLKICSANGWSILGNSLPIKKWADDKCMFPEITKLAGIKCPFNRVINTQEVHDWNKVFKTISYPLVVQSLSNSTNGRGTYFINSSNDIRQFENIWKQERRLKVSKFVDGYNVNTSACVTRSGILISRYFHQLVGFSSLTKVRGAHCGNDTLLKFHLGGKTVFELYDSTLRVGKVLQSRGFKGCFGIDFIIDEQGSACPIELNPRLQSTTGLLNSLQVENGVIPFILFHILEHLQVPYILNAGSYNYNAQHFDNDFAQIVIYNDSSKNVVRRSLIPGIYRIVSGQLSRISDCVSILDLKSSDTFFITRALESGQILKPDEMMHIVQFRKSVLNMSLELNKYTKGIANQIRGFVLGYNN